MSSPRPRGTVRRLVNLSVMSEELASGVPAVDVRYIPPPRRGAGGQYEWDGLHTQPTSDGGLELVTTRALRAGLLIPYNGRYIEDPDDMPVESTDYVLEHVDGNPALEENSNQWAIASYMNEASPGQLYNCVFYGLDSGYEQPAHCTCHSRYILLVADVEAGQPLLASYGAKYAETRARKGYVAAPCTAPHKAAGYTSNLRLVRDQMKLWCAGKNAMAIRQAEWGE